MTPEELGQLDPSTLTGAQRGVLRAMAMTATNPDSRALAARILKTAADPHPGDSYTRGAARGAAYDPTGGSGVSYETDRPDNVRKA